MLVAVALVLAAALMLGASCLADNQHAKAIPDRGAESAYIVTGWDHVTEQHAKAIPDRGAENNAVNPLFFAPPIIGAATSSGMRKARRGTVCDVLKQVVEILDNPIREKILKALSHGSSKTFNELKAETKLSTGGMHYQLEVLWGAGYIDKTTSRPARWFRTQEFDELINLAREGLVTAYPNTDTSERELVEVDAANS